MKFSKKMIAFFCLFLIISIKPRGRGTPAPTVEPTRTVAVQQPQQPFARPQSYAQALEVIRTKMAPQDVLVNNTFTQKFIDFVTSLNLSDIETKALLEAGAYIYVIWTNNDITNDNILSSFKNKIEAITGIQQPTPASIIPNIPVTQPMQKPTSYAQALEVIRTKMAPHDVLINNTFTQKFIDFVISLNLSDLETKALLEAGAYIHVIWNNDDQNNQQIASSLKNTIQTIIPSMPIAPTPVKPIEVIPIVKPAVPAQPTQPLQPQLVPVGEPMKHHLTINNAIIILDPTESESIESESGAMVLRALVALYQQAAPIIVTSNILELILEVKQKIGESDLKKLRTTQASQVLTLSKDLLESHKLEIINQADLEIIGHIDFDNIHYYFHKSSKLVLLIPKKYIATNLPNYGTLNLAQQAQACGFNANIIKPITDITSKNLINELHIQQSLSIDTEQFISQLTSLFTPQKKHGQLLWPEQNIKWVILLAGHGKPGAQSIGDIRKELAEDKNSLIFWQGILEREPQNSNAKKYIPQTKSYIKNAEKILQGKSSWPNSKLVPESARIAGLITDEFVQLLKFFDTNLNMAYLHYSTCFAGGSNQSIVNETLSLFNVDFIVSAEGIDETTTVIEQHKKISDQEPRIQIEGQSYPEFFKLTRLFITQPEEFVKIKGKKQDPITLILRTIVPPSAQQNQPFVRFPAAESFRGAALTKNTKVITQTMAKSHEIEKKSFDFSTADVGTLIIIYPKRLNVPLNLGYGYIKIVSPSPENIISGYEDIHIFKEINYGSSLQALLSDFIELNAKLYKQTFIIRTLTNIYYEKSGLPIIQGATHNIQNVIIQIQNVSGTNPVASTIPAIQPTPLTSDDMPSGKIGANIYTAFEYNNTIYQTTFGIKNFENKISLLLGFEKLNFTAMPKTLDTMNSLAKNFLKPEEITQLTQPITLASIVTFFDKKIDKQDPSIAIWSEADTEALSQTIKKQAQKQK